MADIWRIMWLLIIVITTFVVILLYGPALGNVVDSALRQNANYVATEVAGAISLVGAGPDGMQFTYALPQTEKTDCILIYRTYVSVNALGGATADIVESKVLINVTGFEGANAPDTAASGDWGAIHITCSREAKQLVIMKRSGQVRFGMQYASG